MNAMFWVTMVVAVFGTATAPPQWRWTVWAMFCFGFFIFRQLELLNAKRY